MPPSPSAGRLQLQVAQIQLDTFEIYTVLASDATSVSNRFNHLTSRGEGEGGRLTLTLHKYLCLAFWVPFSSVNPRFWYSDKWVFFEDNSALFQKCFERMVLMVGHSLGL